MQNSIMFIIVSVTVYTVPVFFFCSGFLQTLSFLERDEDTRFSSRSIAGFYVRKVLRYVPLNIMAMLAVLFVMPLWAEGPVWGNFQTLIAPCKTGWVGNLLWANNLTPAEYDDKCLPWTWFIPCYVQLTLLVPPLLFLAASGGILGQALIAGLILALICLNFIMTYAQDIGASVVRNDEFYAKIFMMPYYQAPTFLMGMLSCLIYHQYLGERSNQAAGNSLSTRFFSLISQNAVPRYFMYLIGLGCMGGAVLWQIPFYNSNGPPGRVLQASYASMGLPLFIGGLNLLVMPALVGRAQLFRFVFTSQSWGMLGQMTAGLQYTVPIIGIYYFMATQHQIQITYYMFLYYFTGNLIFGAALYILLLPSDKPIQGYINLTRDAKDAEMSRFYALYDYLENFKDNRLVTIYENSAPRQSSSFQNSVRADTQHLYQGVPAHGGQEIQEQDLRKAKDVYRESNDSREQTSATLHSGAPRDTSARQATHAGSALFNRATGQ